VPTKTASELQQRGELNTHRLPAIARHYHPHLRLPFTSAAPAILSVPAAFCATIAPPKTARRRPAGLTTDCHGYL
jgi:hypothetical protein